MTEGDGAGGQAGKEQRTAAARTRQVGTPFAQPHRISYQNTENTAAREKRESSTQRKPASRRQEKQGMAWPRNGDYQRSRPTHVERQRNSATGLRDQVRLRVSATLIYSLSW